MGGDYKYEMQLLAEEIAEQRYGKEFYELTDDQQYECFMAGSREWCDRMADKGDNLRKAAMENGR